MRKKNYLPSLSTYLPIMSPPCRNIYKAENKEGGGGTSTDLFVGFWYENSRDNYF